MPMSSPPRSAPERAALWSALVAAVLVVGSIVPLLVTAGRGEGEDPGVAHSALHLDMAEVLVALAAVPVLFGIGYVVSLVVIRTRER